MSSSSAAASTLTRPRIAVAVVSAFAVASAGYYLYLYRLAQSESTVLPGPGLHRSNAVRRNRRPTLRQDDSSDDPSDDHGDENVDTNALITSNENHHDNDDENDGQAEADWLEPSRQRTGENIVTLLFRVSEDNARRNAYVHRGCQCNGCGMVPIRGIRYRCANCADFDLCEVCESQGLHNKTHVFYKVRIPAPPFCPRQVQPAWYPGDPDNAARTLPRYLLTKWSNDTGFERVELDAYWEQWTFMANTEWRDDPDGLWLAMDRKTFERCLVPSGGYRHASPNLIHDRMFAFYDTNKDGLIGFDEFLRGVSYRKRTDKLLRTFQGYDIDGDGYVNRKDFLRMFRAYYVLYKQMHRDILEGLDEHMMTTTEAQQLVNSRAPLSSLFGREGRVPQADHSRPMEGKVFRSNGQVDVHDGKDSVVNDDKPDTSNRDEILSGLFSRPNNRSLFTESFGSFRSLRPSTESRYISGIINPPTTISDLSALINGDASRLDDIIASIRDEVAHRPPPEESDGSETDGSDVDEQETADLNQQSDPTSVGGTASSQRSAMPDASRFTNRLPTESELRAQHQAIASNSQINRQRVMHDKHKRVHARRQLHERWKRRQFYLDEEEGGSPPQGWNDNEDILVNLNGIAESSKSAPQCLSSRSRSSSKVRFAEDNDDFDIRSNHSTSSRSVPERWGGMEIPDAERDAGKEILYQVTQQAFNELLDDIFKKKEDLAVRCVETKEVRDRNRHLFEYIELDHNTTTPPTHESSLPGDQPVQDQSLDELLSTSGYTVSPQDEEDHDSDGAHSAHVQGGETSQSRGSVEDKDEFDFVEHLPSEESFASVNMDYKDPTMPQFRPDSSDQARSDNVDADGAQRSQKIRKSTKKLRQKDATTEAEQNAETHSQSEENISQETLAEWKRLDLAEEEAKQRGGWGKLSYDEFEQIYKEHEFQDSSRNRLDYLGSWIDFCIP
ncbi:hypothetical protein BKA67DRAFT_556698 [Truncatella angustata]|uniref:Uncharacterized protein n=1 Tax=Truncatella angustata TaxID=152316 RepID=A0A9P9A137_9PEZI|nr:uncharacterized protein BKA67DRAFT_556698 [Truncatella angustata]KAH6657903.1 hypothetical protein BKA67DRAFT_556698 [Truncatella angustata]KAH8197757.1 hypothetical protein TruAng_008091 [Truncatella angustata]